MRQSQQLRRWKFLVRCWMFPFPSPNIPFPQLKTKHSTLKTNHAPSFRRLYLAPPPVARLIKRTGGSRTVLPLACPARNRPLPRFGAGSLRGAKRRTNLDLPDTNDYRPV